MDSKKRKKVFLLGYLRGNLGDDLFIKILLEKYPIVEFYVKIPDEKYVKAFKKYENLNIILGKDTDDEIYEMNEQLYDAYVYIGGSIFMEGGTVYNLSEKFFDFVRRCHEKNIPFYYISPNYGPYETQEYFQISRNTFKECTDICFRDKFSFDLFKDIPTVRYAPDFAFNYKLKLNKKIKKSIGISIIDLDIREKLKEINDMYYKLLIENIKKYISNGNTVYLFSFCEYEGDNKIIEKILEKFKNKKDKVICVKYTEDIDKFIKIYAKMEYMICTRFHALILSCLARQKLFVLSYSDKINNVIKDLDLQLHIWNFVDLKNNLIIDLNQFKEIEENKILNIIEISKKQDEKFRKLVLNN